MQLSKAAKYFQTPILEDAPSDREMPLDPTSRDPVSAVRLAMEQRGVALIATSDIDPGNDLFEPAPRWADALVAFLIPLLRDPAVAGVVVSGGDTLAALCRGLGVGLLELGDEALPGMPRVRVLDGIRPGLRLVTKSGGFGPDDALIKAVEALLPT